MCILIPRKYDTNQAEQDMGSGEPGPAKALENDIVVGLCVLCIALLRCL